MIVINSDTLAVSTYSVDPLDVVTHEGETYFLTATALNKLTASGFVSGSIKTGQLLIGGQEYNVPMVTLEGEGVSGAVVAHSKERGLGVRVNTVSVPLTTIADRHEIMLGTQPQATSYQFEIQLGGPGRVNHFGAYVNPIRRRRA